MCYYFGREGERKDVMKKRIIVLITYMFLLVATIIPAVLMLKHFAWFYHYGDNSMLGQSAPLHCGLRGIIMSIDNTIVWGGISIILWTFLMIITVTVTIYMYVRIASNEPSKVNGYGN